MIPFEFYLDFDDVIKPLVPRWIEEVNKRLGKNIKYDDVTTFEFMSKYKDILLKIDHSVGEPEAGVIDFVNDLIKNNCVVFVVSATPPSQIQAKSTWLYKYARPLYKYTIWTSHKDKLAAPGRILIDDAVHNLKAWQESGGHAIAFDRPWNQDWDGIRVHSFTTFWNEISEQAEKLR